MKRVLGSIRRADERYHLFENGDKVCIGVSGGKDSLLLMEALKLYQRFSRTEFQVCAVTRDLGIVAQDCIVSPSYTPEIAMCDTIGPLSRVTVTHVTPSIIPIRRFSLVEPPSHPPPVVPTMWYFFPLRTAVQWLCQSPKNTV